MIEDWVNDVIEFHNREKDPELKKINDKWYSYCGCEGGCSHHIFINKQKKF
ncbi:MAG: hypothetical protein J1F35_06635 [Erysipelotrichales bacterium]|nr:hypothetical protein [Erysipelotrichales bacterium]